MEEVKVLLDFLSICNDTKMYCNHPQVAMLCWDPVQYIIEIALSTGLWEVELIIRDLWSSNAAIQQ